MKKLLTSSAVAVIFGSMALGAQAQTSTDANSQAVADDEQICQAQWTLVDGNEDGFVTREEATAVIGNEFGQIDSDGNGEITKTEYIDCRTRNADMQSAEADRDEESFASVDANQDEGIDREEFGQSAQQAYESSRSATSADAEPLMVLRRFVWLAPEEASSDMTQNLSADEAAARSAMTFERLDADGDNIIDTREWVQATSPRGLTQDMAGARFDRLDADSSGAIGQDEYTSARSAGLDQMETGSVSGASAEDPADSAADESAMVEDATAQEEGEQARAGVPAFIYRLNDGGW